MVEGEVVAKGLPDQIGLADTTPAVNCREYRFRFVQQRPQFCLFCDSTNQSPSSKYFIDCLNCTTTGRFRQPIDQGPAASPHRSANPPPSPCIPLESPARNNAPLHALKSAPDWTAKTTAPSAALQPDAQPTNRWIKPTICFGARCPTLRAKTGTTISARRSACRLGQVPRERHTRQGASDGCADGDETGRIRHRHQNHPRPFSSHKSTAAKVIV